ncbi:hypothetical protein HY439_01670 [Candidatus Microgenomates bacterium]|nr:hypothetical protein [Candidatus Microgenomates bacterium]
MPKQIISDVLDELGEFGKQTAKQIASEPGKIAATAGQQAGVKPQTPEEKNEAEAKIQDLTKGDEEKKVKELAFVRKQMAVFNQPPPPQPTVQEQQQREKQIEMLELEQKEQKKLPTPKLMAQRKGPERKGNVSG